MEGDGDDDGENCNASHEKERVASFLFPCKQASKRPDPKTLTSQLTDHLTGHLAGHSSNQATRKGKIGSKKENRGGDKKKRPVTLKQGRTREANWVDLILVEKKKRL